MKKIALILITFSGFYSFSQMVVADPILQQKAIEEQLIMKKEIAETIKQTATLNESYKVASESLEIFKKVSQALKNLTLVSETLQTQFKIVKRGSEVLNNIKSLNISPEDIKKYDGQLEAVLKSGDQTIQLVNTVMQSDAINANDAERIQILMSVQEQQKEYLAQLSRIQRSAKNKDRINSLYNRK